MGWGSDPGVHCTAVGWEIGTGRSGTPGGEGRAGPGCRSGSERSDLALTPLLCSTVLSLTCHFFLPLGHSFGVLRSGFWFYFPSQSF